MLYHTEFLNAVDFGASGSSFIAEGQVTAESRRITVEDPGDFRVGQGVSVSGCFPRLSDTHYDSFLWGPGSDAPGGRKLNGEVELRIVDGNALAEWTVFMLDCDPKKPRLYRWTDDLGRTWQEDVPMTFDWQKLSHGAEVRFHPFKWEKGYTAVFGARCDLVTVIEAIEGNVLVIKNAATRSCRCTVSHNDTNTLQSAVDAAIAARTGLFIPNGHYAISTGLVVRDAEGFTLKGESAEGTILDISRGEGACVKLLGGIGLTVRDLSMLGNMGFAERDQAGLIKTRGGYGPYGFYFRRTCAMHIGDADRVLVQDCHARRMSGECFYHQGKHRMPDSEPSQYTKSLTFDHCSVEDCARNAFNNNDEAENTSMLYCRIRDVGGCSWEGASRFVKMVGCYVRNAGTVAMGNIRNRREEFERLPSGQHFIVNNVFESICPYGECMIRAASNANQVIIQGNSFLNFNTSAVEVTGDTTSRDMPAQYAIINGNSFDMTAEEGPSRPRTAIAVSASDVIVSDNQIFVRGKADANLTGITLRDDALQVSVHDNQLSGCGVGIISKKLTCIVGQVLSPTEFTRGGPYWGGRPPLLRRRSHGYRGWRLLWLNSEGATCGESVMDHFDPETCVFHLKEPRELHPGDRFELYRPGGNGILLHDNLIDDCDTPLRFDGHVKLAGSPGTILYTDAPAE